jgi:hypothetical protein
MIKYQFRNKKSKKLTQIFDYSMDEMERYLERNPSMEVVIGTPGFHSGLGLKKPDDGFRDVLKSIKRLNSRGISKSTINTF